MRLALTVADGRQREVDPRRLRQAAAVTRSTLEPLRDPIAFAPVGLGPQTADVTKRR